MNRSMMPEQIMAYNQGGIASFVPKQTQIMGQPHRLAYVNPQEEQMMLNAGGAGLPGPGGIPAYWLLTEPSTWYGGSNYEPGAGFEGVGNFNASDNDNTSYTDTSSIAGISEASGVNYTGDDDNDQTVGFVDSIAMGFGLKDKTPAYYNTTAQTIAANQGQTAAQNYLKGLADDGKISSSSLGIFSDAASQVSFNDNTDDDDDNDNVVDSVNDETEDDETEDDETVDGEEEIQYTQMKPFYGGYQPSTIASTLVPSQLTRPTGPNPRLDPIYPQLPSSLPGSEIIPHNDGQRVGFDFGAPANLGDTHYDPELDTTYTYQEKPDGQGGFYSGWDITQGTGPEVVLYGGGGSQGLGTNFASGMTETNPLTGLPSQGLPSQGQFNSFAELDAYQQQNPSANLMLEYQRLRDLSGDIPEVAQLPNRGIASIFGNEQAPPYMYQGIMG
jgi:hypothetical protein